MTPALASSAVFGALCAPVGIAVGAFIGFAATGKGYELFFLAAGLAAFLTAFACWWLLVERPGKSSLTRGGVAGGIAGIFAHYLCWYFLLAGNYARALAGGESLKHVIDPLTAIASAFVYTFWSLLLLGWITFPAGVAAGVGYAMWRKRKAGSTSA